MQDRGTVRIERSEDGNYMRVVVNDKHTAVVTMAEWSEALAKYGSFWTGRYGKVTPMVDRD